VKVWQLFKPDQKIRNIYFERNISPIWINNELRLKTPRERRRLNHGRRSISKALGFERRRLYCEIQTVGKAWYVDAVVTGKIGYGNNQITGRNREVESINCRSYCKWWYLFSWEKEVDWMREKWLRYKKWRGREERETEMQKKKKNYCEHLMREKLSIGNVKVNIFQFTVNI